jgi:hypothetical protein
MVVGMALTSLLLIPAWIWLPSAALIWLVGGLPLAAVALILPWASGSKTTRSWRLAGLGIVLLGPSVIGMFAVALRHAE